MKKPILAILLITVAFVLSINSCTKTVTETVYDTTRDTLRLHDTAGPALIRFISLLPDTLSQGAPVILSLHKDGPTGGFYANTTMTGSYYPVRQDTAVLYYVFASGHLIDSLPMPPLKANSVYTYALFLSGGRLYIVPPANDSAKLKQAPRGYCYLRFINGLPDFPVAGPTYYVVLDSAGASRSLFYANGQPRSVAFSETSEYVAIPTGSQTIELLPAIGADHDFALSYSFQEGSYYTARVVGQHLNGTAKFQIDAE